jgi:hypothetical protein
VKQFVGRELAEESEEIEENQAHCHFVNQKSHVT